MKGYIVKEVKGWQVDRTLGRYVYEAGLKVSDMYGDKFPGWEHFKIKRFADDHLFLVCYKDGKPVGFLGASKLISFFSQDITLFRQELLYAEPGTRASLLLLKMFVDIGKRHANHVITMLGAKTNIKRRSLERLGFVKLEELYRLEK